MQYAVDSGTGRNYLLTGCCQLTSCMATGWVDRADSTLHTVSNGNCMGSGVPGRIRAARVVGCLFAIMDVFRLQSEASLARKTSARRPYHAGWTILTHLRLRTDDRCYPIILIIQYWGTLKLLGKGLCS